jgi:uncharacterized membrane protein YuzA (DUF378 family)
MKVLHIIAHILLWVGGINWGLVGLAMLVSPSSNWNVVHLLLGTWPTVEAIVYVLVGLAALWALVGHRKDCKMCSA